MSTAVPLAFTTFTFHLPRLSTTKISITDVVVFGSMNESVCGSVVICVNVRTRPAGSTHANRRLKAGSTPNDLAQTVSPKLKSVFGVTQSGAYVARGGGAPTVKTAGVCEISPVTAIVTF